MLWGLLLACLLSLLAWCKQDDGYLLADAGWYRYSAAWLPPSFSQIGRARFLVRCKWYYSTTLGTVKAET